MVQGTAVCMQVNVTDVDDKIIKRARVNRLLADYVARREAEAVTDSAAALSAVRKEASEAAAAFGATTRAPTRTLTLAPTRTPTRTRTSPPYPLAVSLPTSPPDPLAVALPTSPPYPLAVALPTRRQDALPTSSRYPLALTLTLTRRQDALPTSSRYPLALTLTLTRRQDARQAGQARAPRGGPARGGRAAGVISPIPPYISPTSPPYLPHISPISQTLLEQQKQKLASWVTSEDAIAKAVADPKGSVSLPLARTLPLEPLPPLEVTPQLTPTHPNSPQLTPTHPKSPQVTPSHPKSPQAGEGGVRCGGRALERGTRRPTRRAIPEPNPKPEPKPNPEPNPKPNPKPKPKPKPKPNPKPNPSPKLDAAPGAAVTDHAIFNAHSRRYEAEFIEDLAALHIR